MRTRNQREKQHEEPSSSRGLSDKSKEAVGRLLNRSNSRRSGKKKQDSPLCWPDYANIPEGSNEEDKQNTDEGPHNTHTSPNNFPQETCQKENVSCAFPQHKEDTNEVEWEDGFVHMPDSGDYPENNVVVEFYDSPSSSKKKPIRRATAEEKELAELVHKVHLLCLVARGRVVDSACNDPLIQGALLSLLPSHLLKIVDVPKLTANDLTPLVKWLHDNFRVKCSDQERTFNSSLAFALENRIGTSEEVAALSVALFRALNLTVRFVSILDVASLKPIADGSGSLNYDMTGLDSRIFDSSTLMVTKQRQASASPVNPSPQKVVRDKGSCAKGMNFAVQNALASAAHNNTSEVGHAKVEGAKRKGDREFELQLEMAVFATATGMQSRSKSSSELKDLPSSSSSSPLNKIKRIKTEESSVISHGISTAVGSSKVGPPLYWAEVFCDGESLTGKWVHVDVVNELIACEEKVEAAISACRRTLRYVVAFAGNGAKDVTRRYCTKWYTISSKRVNSQWWDVVLAPLKELESRATGGVIPMDVQKESANALNMVNATTASSEAGVNDRDQAPLERIGSEMSKKHDSNNNLQSSSENSRVASRSVLEDMELQTRALTEPLPTNQQAYRNHHLYAIERWLTKYEILRPKGPVLGYCSGHPVYPRTCIQTLQTKQRWLREGLQIKANESPAKVLKHPPKHSKAQTSEPDDCKQGDSEGGFALYGKWQTEPLCLPPAVNGIVPRNERGQVDVWSEKCLPPGTVHLRFPRVVPVAKRLGVDFAPAMVGFEFRNGRSFPVFEGIVVCSEFKDAIIEAYAEEEEKRGAEEKKRNQNQAISRWYQLLSSIITRQRLKDEYGDGSTSEIPNRINRNELVSELQATNLKGNISDERQRGYVSKSDLTTQNQDHEHIFPLEDQSFDEETSVITKRCPCGFVVEVEEF